jgi:hypothetical protein
MIPIRRAISKAIFRSISILQAMFTIQHASQPIITRTKISRLCASPLSQIYISPGQAQRGGAQTIYRHDMTCQMRLLSTPTPTHTPSFISANWSRALRSELLNDALLGFQLRSLTRGVGGGEVLFSWCISPVACRAASVW